MKRLVGSVTSQPTDDSLLRIPSYEARWQRPHSTCLRFSTSHCNQHKKHERQGDDDPEMSHVDRLWRFIEKEMELVKTRLASQFGSQPNRYQIALRSRSNAINRREWFRTKQPESPADTG